MDDVETKKKRKKKIKYLSGELKGTQYPRGKISYNSLPLIPMEKNNAIISILGNILP